MVDVGGRRLHAVVYGTGGPTGVLVSGFQAPQAYRNPLVEGIAEVTTAVTYDRAGYGKSERGGLPVDGRQSASDLHVLLGKLGVPKPYLLVGHSYGGRVVRLFASAYPSETAGLILEEASHEDLPEAQLEALTGRDRETLAAMIAPYRTAVPDPVTETDYMAATVEQLRRSGPLPRVPLVVITSASRGSGLPPVFSPEGQAKLDDAAAAMQKKLVLLVPGAEQIFVEGAGHNVHLDKPEAVLVPIRAMIARLRALDPSPRPRPVLSPRGAADAHAGRTAAHGRYEARDIDIITGPGASPRNGHPALERETSGSPSGSP
jgi:pimeloyl-ACP methyl ester carboxylesterase